MSRPVQIASLALPVGQDFNIALNPWQLFFENPRVFEKLKNFRNLRGDLKIKLVVNGNPFYYGSYIMYYHPLHTVDSRTSQNNSLQGIIQFSQMPHIYIDPCEGTGGEITVPYFYNKDAMNIIDRDWQEMGQIVIRTIFPLQHANDNTEPIDVAIFAMAQNVVLSTPTSRVPVENQADEYGKPSFVAHSIAKSAGWFTHIPVIGKYARATQMLFENAGDIASLFGYSRPRVVEEAVNMRIRPGSSLAVVNVPDNIGSLALDAKKEVTIDPRVVGLVSSDEMAIQPIAMRESFLTVFPWNENAAPEQHLFSVRVNPVQGDLTTTGDHYITPAAFTSLPFKFWRGTMRYRFNIIASKYHRGRLKFVWDPEFNGDQSGSNYNSNYITVVDINQQKDITLDIGWGSNFSYLEVGGLVMPKFSTSAFNSPSMFANGTLSVFVVNSLTSPGPTNSDAAVAVFTSACDDYEVACPDSVFLEGDLNVRASPIPPPSELPPVDGNDGGALPPVINPPTNPTVPPPPPPDPEEGEEIITPDGIGFGNSRFWPNPSIPQGIPIERTTNQADLPKGPPGATFVVPPFITTGILNIFTSSEQLITIQHLDENLNILSTQEVLTLENVNSSLVLEILDDASLLQEKYHYIRIIAPVGNYVLRLVDMEIGGILFQKFTAQDMNARLASGGTPTYDSNGHFSFSFLNTTDKLILDVPAGLNSADNSPIIHYMMVGVGGVVHTYGGRNRAPGASSTFKFAIADELVYARPGVMELGVAAVAIPVLGEFTFEGALLMYYPSVQSQAVLMEDQSEESDVDLAAKPVASESHEQMAPSLPGMQTNSVYFGEQVTSWRQVLKRYETVAQFSSSTPRIRWSDAFTELATGSGLDVRRLNMVSYVRSAYVGARGGMRIKVLPLGDINAAGTVVISNMNDAKRDNIDLQLPSWSGSVFEPLPLTGVADAEIPYYSNLRFFYSRLGGQEYSGSSGPNTRRGLQRLEADINVFTSNNNNYVIAQAIAEDYSLHFFLSAPVLNFLPAPVVNPPFG